MATKELIPQAGSCEHCGVIFARVNRKKRFCSAACERKRRRQKKNEARRCPQCQRPLSCRLKFCSDECQAAFAYQRQVKKEGRTCRQCGKTPAGRTRYCGKACQLAGTATRRYKFKRTCRGCGAGFLGIRKNQVFHSIACRIAFNARQAVTPAAIVHKKNRERECSRKRRLRWNAVEHEPYKDFDIFERDRWTCWLCKKKVDPAYDCPHPKSATMDHVVPLNKGGADAPHNVHCAHFGCNSAKGQKTLTLW